MKVVSAKLPMIYIEVLDQWRQAHCDPRVTQGDALEHFLALGMGMDPPNFEGRRRPVSKAEIDERGEQYCQLYAELGSYTAVSRQVGFSVATVTKVITRHERNSR